MHSTLGRSGLHNYIYGEHVHFFLSTYLQICHQVVLKLALKSKSPQSHTGAGALVGTSEKKHEKRKEINNNAWEARRFTPKKSREEEGAHNS